MSIRVLRIGVYDTHTHTHTHLLSDAGTQFIFFFLIVYMSSVVAFPNEHIGGGAAVGWRIKERV